MSVPMHPARLTKKVEKILLDLPLLMTPQGRALFIVSAELGDGFEDRIDCRYEGSRFVLALLRELTESAPLPDGRDPVVMILKAARIHARGDLARRCEDLLRILESERAPAPPPRPAERSPHVRRLAREKPGPLVWRKEEILRQVRGRELEFIRETFEVVRLRRDNGAPGVCYLYGRRGAGTTALLQMAQADLCEWSRPKGWRVLLPRSGSMGINVPLAGPQEPPLIQRIYDAFTEADRNRHFGDFELRHKDFSERFRAIVEERCVGEPTTRSDLLQVIELGGLILFNLLTSQNVFPEPLEMQVLGRFIDVSNRLLWNAAKWLKDHLSQQDIDILRRSRSQVAKALACGLKRYTQDRGYLIFGIDRCDELPLGCADDLTEIMRNSGPQVFWLLSGKCFPPASAAIERMRDPLVSHFEAVAVDLLTEKEVLTLLEAASLRNARSIVAVRDLRQDAALIYKATQGTPLFVAMALDRWSNGKEVEGHLHQFFLHYLRDKLEAKHCKLLFAFLLTPFENRDDRLQILGRLCGLGNLHGLVTEMVSRCPAISGSSNVLEIHTTFAEHVKSYLSGDAVRSSPEIKEIHIQAFRILNVKRRKQEVLLPTLVSRMIDERWQEIELARLYHLFHLDINRAWMELGTLALGTWALRQLEFLGRVLHLLQSIRAFLGGLDGRRLDRFVAGLSEAAGPEEKRRLVDELCKLLDQKRLAEPRLFREPWTEEWAGFLAVLQQQDQGSFGTLPVPLNPPDQTTAPVERRGGVVVEEVTDRGAAEEMTPPEPPPEASKEQRNVLRVAEGLLEQGDYPKALELFSKILERDQACAEARLGLGECYTQMERFEEAVVEYRGAVGESVLARTRLGSLYLSLEAWNEAREMYLWALRSDPRDALCLRGVAESFVGLGLYQEAFDYFREAHAAGARDARVLRGLLFSARKQRELASNYNSDLDIYLAEALTLIASDGCDLYDRACLAALAGRDLLALHLLYCMLGRQSDQTDQAIKDPHLETVRKLPAFQNFLNPSGSCERRAMRRHPIFLLLACRTSSVELILSRDSGLGVLCRELSRVAGSCWLSVIQAGPEARQILPLVPVEEPAVDSLADLISPAENGFWGDALEVLRKSMRQDLVPASPSFPEGDHRPWVIVIFDHEPVGPKRPAWDDLRNAPVGAPEKFIALGISGVNSETLRFLAPFHPHESVLMPDPTPKRLADFFQDVGRKCVAAVRLERYC